MKIINFLFFIIFIHQLSAEDFETVMTNLKILENYIREYIEEKHPDSSLTHLITCYIREGAYTGTEWTMAGGSIPNDLSQYIIDKDTSEGTNAQLCKTYREVILPNNETIDFVHFFAVMNGIEKGDSYSGEYAHLVGWGGDTFQLLEDILNENGNLNELMEKAKEYFMIKGGFDAADFVSDLDAPILLKKKNDSSNFDNIIKTYYNSEEYLERVNNFVEITFPSIKKKEEFRKKLFNVYNNDFYIRRLELKKGLRNGNMLLTGDIKDEYANHQKAAVYVVSDYLSEQYEPTDASEFSINISNSYFILLGILLIYLF